MSRSRIGLYVIAVAAFLMTADVTITSVALPSIARDMSASMADLQWIVDSYNIVVAGMVLLGAGLGERFGRKRLFLTGILLFLAGSLVAGLSGSVAQLVTARTIMGIGAALLLAPALSLITMLFPPDQRGHAVGLWAAAGGLGLAAAPVLAGVILSVASWEWLFLMNLPLMAAAVLVGLVVLPPGGAPDPAPLDVVGAALSVVGFCLLLGALIEGPRQGWTSPSVLLGLVGGAGVIAAFVAWELRREHPMIEIRILRRRGVAAAALSLLLCYVAYTGSLFLASQQLQSVIGVTDLVLGLCLAPGAVIFWVLSVRAPWVLAQLGASRSLVLGLILMAAGFGLAVVSTVVDAPWAVIVMLCVSAVGWALVIPIGTSVIANDLPVRYTGSGSGASMLSRLMGAAFGIAVLGTVVATVTGGSPAHADASLLDRGISLAYAAGGLLLLAGLAVVVPLLRGWSPAGAPSQDAASPG